MLKFPLQTVEAIEVETGCRDRASESPPACIGNDEAQRTLGSPADHRDPLVTEPDEVLGGQFADPFVVDAHRRMPDDVRSDRRQPDATLFQRRDLLRARS